MDFSLEELAAQFKKAQQVESSHRLSERNCVEILMKLISRGDIRVIYTLNGREYLTSNQLEKEIKEEIEASKGRINVTELVPLLNVDLGPIEKKVAEIVRNSHGSLIMIEGEIISNAYLDRLTMELNETLQERGFITLSDASLRFGLPLEVVERTLEKRSGSLIFGNIQNRFIYTDNYLDHYMARVRGIFTAISRPTSIHNIISKNNFEESLFLSTLDKLIENRRLRGSYSGGYYTPFAYANARLEKMDSFYNQNGYIDYQRLEKMDYTNPKSFLESRFKDGISLQNHYVAKRTINQVNEVAEEAIQSDSWADIQPFIPSVLSDKEIGQLLEACTSLVQVGKNPNCLVLENYFVISKGLLTKCNEIIQTKIKERADKGLITRQSVVETPQEEEEEDEDRGRKKGKGSASTSTKKGGKKEVQSKGKPNSKSNAKQESPNAGEEKEVLEEFKKQFEDMPEELHVALCEYFKATIAKVKETVSRAIFIENVNNENQKGESQGKAKVSKKSIQEDLKTLYHNIQLFQRGTKALALEDSSLLEKYLLKSLCSEFVRLILIGEAAQNFITVEGELKTPSEQSKIMAQLPASLSDSIKKLNATLNEKSSEKFTETLESLADRLELHLKPLDKKSEKSLLSTHRQTWMDQLNAETNPATCLHLVVLLLFLKKKGAALHIPGRSVSSVITQLKADLPAPVHAQLLAFQAKVVKFLNTEKEESQLQEDLTEDVSALKELVLGKEEPKQ
eukprot:TRINITY_DN205_c1_g1_i2.p1 TRINITY_DN205_c1_g1~~TRINITY_DN205_c1_g1_i2.p1  ORF type:complete len:738 (-),score=341.84 TRINITY_DN205_c1_g1_i2:37-2250(-)